MKKLSKRELLFFFLGIIFTLLVDLALDWKSHVEAFQQGYEDARNN